jgi:hypothetical protein
MKNLTRYAVMIFALWESVRKDVEQRHAGAQARLDDLLKQK